MSQKFDFLTAGTDITIEKTSTCVYCGDEFPIFDIEKQMLDKHEFIDTPQCHLCTFRMLSLQMNDRHLYRRKCSDSGENIISVYSPESARRVLLNTDYQQKILDEYGMKFGRDISDDIMSEFQQMYSEFPRKERFTFPGLENCSYASHLAYAKNVYLSFCVFSDCENIYFSFQVVGGCRNVFSSYGILASENIFSSSEIMTSNKVFYSHDIIDSSDILLCHGIVNCQECIMCCNQVNQKYKVFNKQYSQQEYEKIKIDILERINSANQFQELRKNYDVFLENNYIESAMMQSNNQKISGDTVANSNNSVHIFMMADMEDSCNSCSGGGDGQVNSNIFNCSELGAGVKNALGSVSIGYNMNNIFFSMACVEGCNNIYYSRDLQNCQECMFCIGIENKKYCILNKQYEKQEYLEKKEKIIQDLKNTGKWGSYLWFDISIQDYPYNDTLAYDYFKVNSLIHADGRQEIVDADARGTVTLKSSDFLSEAVLDLGGSKKIDIIWRTQEKEVNIPDDMKILDAQDIGTTSEIGEDILDKAILCEETGRPFRIIAEELAFCKKHSLPLPHLHHEIRLDKLMSLRPKFDLHLGKSDLSGDDILTVYKDKPKWKVYSHEEYKKFMYG